MPGLNTGSTGRDALGWRPGRGGVLDRLVGRAAAGGGRRRRPPDRGAVAVVVAILLAGGVLLGFLALVVDVGQIYVEREVLQSGADAAALAAARACATDAAGCASTTAIETLAGRYADLNADDGLSHVAQVCGFLPGKLSPCGPVAGNLTDCLGSAPTGTTPYVEVRLTTEVPDGRFALPPVFAQTMSGNEGYAGSDVGACARATWQSGAALSILAMTISICEFNADTADNTLFPPDLTHPREVDERTINYWEGAFDGPCDNPDGPFEAPGRAGFLDGGGSQCERSIPTDGDVLGAYVPHIDFTLLPQSCEDRVRQARANQEIVYLPVHDGIEDQPEDKELFHHRWLAPFLVTGFQFGPPFSPPGEDLSGHDEPSTITAHDPCLDIYERCLSGLFTGPLVELSNVVAGGDAIVKLIG